MEFAGNKSVITPDCIVAFVVDSVWLFCPQSVCLQRLRSCEQHGCRQE